MQVCASVEMIYIWAGVENICISKRDHVNKISEQVAEETSVY